MRTEPRLAPLPRAWVLGLAARCRYLPLCWTAVMPCLAPLPRAWVLGLGGPLLLSWWTGVPLGWLSPAALPLPRAWVGCGCLTACAPMLHGLACCRPSRGPSSSAASADNWLSLVAQTARSSLLPRPLGRFKYTHQCVLRTCSGSPAVSRVLDVVGDEANLSRRALSQARTFTVHTSSFGVMVLLCSVWPGRKEALWST